MSDELIEKSSDSTNGYDVYDITHLGKVILSASNRLTEFETLSNRILVTA
jgi:hypothetical protein